MSAAEPPPGFELQTNRGPFTTHNGPYYGKRVEIGVAQAFFAEARHCNSFGIVHGGMISAFLDGLLAGAVGREARTRLVTLHLSIDFLAMGRAHEWIIGEGHVTRLARDTAFAEGVARVGERPIARATGVFKLMQPRNPAASGST
jgi:uncharacterized protein (TIGR00369 family)